MNTQNTIAGIARSAVLVDMVISLYSGRKLDQKTRDEVTSSKGANSRRAASVYKSLFADCKELEDISKFQSRVRLAHYRMTKPWNDVGSRILPTSLLQEYTKDMNRYTQEFDMLVDKFLDKYDTLVAAAAFQLGTLFDRTEYPARDAVAKKFGITITYTPLPTAGDFRLDVEHEVQEQLVRQYEQKMQAMAEEASRNSWEQLHNILTRISDRLATDTDEDGNPKRRIFHESMLDGATDLCDMLTHLNITQDPALEKARAQLEASLHGVTAKELRESDGLRVDTKQKVDAILSAFDWGDM